MRLAALHDSPTPLHDSPTPAPRPPSKTRRKSLSVQFNEHGSMLGQFDTMVWCAWAESTASRLQAQCCDALLAHRGTLENHHLAGFGGLRNLG